MILTDSHNLLQEPVILPFLKVDDKKEGKDSDHKGAQCLLRRKLAHKGGAVKDKIVVRRFPEYKILDAGLELLDVDWNFLRDEMTVDSLLAAFEEHKKNICGQVFS